MWIALLFFIKPFVFLRREASHDVDINVDNLLSFSTLTKRKEGPVYNTKVPRSFSLLLLDGSPSAIVERLSLVFVVKLSVLFSKSRGA